MRFDQPFLILLSLLLGAGLAVLTAFISIRLTKLAAALSVLASLYFSIQSFLVLLANGPWHYELGGWAPPWGIELVIGPFTCFFGCLILSIALLTLFYSRHLRLPGPMGLWKEKVLHPLLLVLTAAVLGMIFVRDVFTLYLLLEVSILSAAGLLACFGDRNWVDTFHLVLWGSVCASLFLAGVITLYAVTGTTHLDDILAQLFIAKNEAAVLTGGFFLTFAWTYHFNFLSPFFFPRLLNHLPSYVLGFFSSVMVRVAAYLLFIVYFFALGVPGFTPPFWLTVLEYLVVFSFLADFFFASRQKDFQHALAFLSLGQLSFLFLGFLLGNKSALTGSLMELLSQVLVVSGLFLIAENLREGAGAHPLSRLAGLVRHRPMTGLALVIFISSIAGVPPTGGFFGKYYLIQGALEKHDWVILAALGLTIAFNFFYFAKLTGFLVEHRETYPAQPASSFASKLPILLLAVGVILLGMFHQGIIHDYVEPALPKAFQNLPVPNVPFLGKAVE
jgi:multicomponent Na+:H+ antiporter subunit D